MSPSFVPPRSDGANPVYATRAGVPEWARLTFSRGRPDSSMKTMDICPRMNGSVAPPSEVRKYEIRLSSEPS